jgi:hypothetical protein
MSHGNISDVIEEIENKDALHRWIDQLPPGTSVVCIADVPNEHRADYRFTCMGDQTIPQSAWMVESYRDALKQYMRNV